MIRQSVWCIIRPVTTYPLTSQGRACYLFQSENWLKILAKLFLLIALCYLFMSKQMLFDNYSWHSSYCENKGLTFTCFFKNVFEWARVRVCTPSHNVTPRLLLLCSFLYLKLKLLKMYLDLLVWHNRSMDEVEVHVKHFCAV